MNSGNGQKILMDEQIGNMRLPRKRESKTTDYTKERRKRGKGKILLFPSASFRRLRRLLSLSTRGTSHVIPYVSTEFTVSEAERLDEQGARSPESRGTACRPVRLGGVYPERSRRARRTGDFGEGAGILKRSY
jgi:hypothetical protein